MKATPAQIKQLHMLLNASGEMARKAFLVKEHTNCRTTSSKEMTLAECARLIDYLRVLANQRRKAMRGKIIYYLCLLGMTDERNDPDYKRINDFIANIGSNNPRKVILNYLYYNELVKVVSQVEAMYKKETKI